MKVLADFHHHALAESLLMLFEDRYGWQVWFPTGMAWFDADIWQFERAWHGDKVARQYLEGIWDGATYEPAGVRLRHDPRHPWRVHKGITLEAARSQSWDIVLSSLPHNDAGYHRFATETGARFGVQVGNDMQDSRWDLATFVLASSTLPGFGPEWIGKTFDYHGCPTVMYHQEFDLRIFRHEWPPENRREVASWVNCFPEGPSYPWFAEFARRHANGFDFRVFGAYGSGAPDEFQAGDVSLVTEVAERMRGARIGWHSKHWSDGFGHTIHDWFAIGRPLIGIQRYYRDRIAGILWVEGETAFDVERRSEDELLALMRKLRDDDDYHRRICENAARRFREVVDFDHEADVIRALLA